MIPSSSTVGSIVCTKSTTDSVMATKRDERLIYGEMVILGYNGQLPRGNLGRKRSKFILRQHAVANGVSIKFEQNGVIVQGEKDENTDMFQFGRSYSLKNQFVILDHPNSDSSKCKISRFCCRVTVDRNDKNVARVYAAGFDNSNKIALDEFAIKWRNSDGSVNGLTPNGVLISHPKDEFSGGRTSYQYWHELSVTGNLYSLRESKESRRKGEFISTGSNVLKDGTLISLDGVTMLWRSAEGLSKSASEDDVENLISYIDEIVHKHVPFDEVSILGDTFTSNKPLPYAHVECGHVQFYKEADLKGKTNSNCPTCRKPSAVTRLCMGLERAVYVDYSVAVYTFNPCGHVATELTAELWKTVLIPDYAGRFIPKCPFCAIPLKDRGCVKLMFPNMRKQPAKNAQRKVHLMCPTSVKIT